MAHCHQIRRYATTWLPIYDVTVFTIGFFGRKNQESAKVAVGMENQPLEASVRAAAKEHKVTVLSFDSVGGAFRLKVGEVDVELLLGAEIAFVVSPNFVQERFAQRSGSTDPAKVIALLVEICNGQAGSGSLSFSASASDFGSGSGYSSLANSLITSMDLAESSGTCFFDLDGAIRREIDEANTLLGAESADPCQINSDLGLARVRFSLANLFFSREDFSLKRLCNWFKVDPETEFSIDFSFPPGAMPTIASVSVLRNERSQHDAFVTRWLSDIVRHVMELWFSDKRDDLRHYGVNSTSVGGVMEKQSVMESIVEKFKTKKVKKLEPVSELGDVEFKFISRGGIVWTQSDSASQTPAVGSDLYIVNSLLQMGFNYLDIQMAFSGTQSLEDLVSILSDERNHASALQKAECEMIATETGLSEAAVAKSFKEANFVKADAEKLLQTMTDSRKIETTQKNFYCALLEFLGERLRNVTRYCVSCHAPHNCNGSIGVICPAPLCVFRWQEFQLETLIPVIKALFMELIVESNVLSSSNFRVGSVFLRIAAAQIGPRNATIILVKVSMRWLPNTAWTHMLC